MAEQKPKTHAVSKPNKTEITTVGDVRSWLEGDNLNKQIVSYFRNDKAASMQFVTAAIDYIRRTPKLLECTKTSLIMSFLQLAQFRFMPSSVSGEAFVIPYKDRHSQTTQAQFQLGYQGILTLLYRHPKVSTVAAQIVYENDTFEYEEGLEPRLVHKPAIGEDRGKPVAVYAVAKMADGSKVFKVMSEDEVMKIKAMSKAAGSKHSPWNSNDPEKWMWRKTCIIQLSKTLPKTHDFNIAVAKDYEGSGLEMPTLDPEGPGTGAANHRGDIADAEIDDDEEDEEPKQKVDEETGIPIIDEDDELSTDEDMTDAGDDGTVQE